MPSQPPSRKRQSTAISESPVSKESSKKRKISSSTTPPSATSHKAKRTKTTPLKAETDPSTEQNISKSVRMAADSIFDTIVTIIVGKTATDFGIHRGLVCRASSYFKQQLSCETTSIVLKDEDPEIFRRFKNWLYLERLDSESETYKNLPWKVIIQIYSFAERKGVPRLQNSCVDAVIKKIEDGGLLPGQTDVNSLWKVHGNFFRLRRLLLDLFATECNLTSATTNNGSYHPQFLQGLVQTLFEMKVKRTIYDRVNFWQKRQNYYVDNNENPILVD